MRSRCLCRWIPVVAVASIAACGGRSVEIHRPLPAPDRKLSFTPRAHAFEGNNGYHFWVLPEPGAGVVRVDVRYPVGARRDPAGKEGLAHLVEHLLFLVEVERDGETSDLKTELARHALYSNAYTSADSMHFEAQALPGSLDALFRIEAERMRGGCGGISPEIFEREREVVLNELRQTDGTGGALRRKLSQALYPTGHPYRKVDTLESVAKLEYQDACAFIAGPLKEGTAFVIVSGNVTAQEVAKAAGAHFASIPPRRPRSDPAPAAVKAAPRRLEIDGDVDKPIVIYAWPMPERSSFDYRATDLTRRLMLDKLQALAREDGWATSVSSSVWGGSRAPFVLLVAELEDQDRAAEADEALKKAHEYAFDQALWGRRKGSEQWRIRRRLYFRQLLSSYESLGGRARMYADMLQFTDDRRMLVGLLEEMEKTNPRTAHDKAGAALALSRVTRIVIRPRSGGRKQVAMASLFEPRHDATHGIAVDPAEADRPLPEPPVDRLMLDTMRFRTRTGLRVVFWPHGRLPLVHGRLVTTSGMAHEPDGALGVSHLAGFDRVYDDSMVYWLELVSTHIDELVAGLGRRLRKPGIRLDAATRSALKKSLERGEKSQRARFHADFWASMYGREHPYARLGITSENLAALSTEKVKDWVGEHVVPANSTLIVSGDFRPNLARKYVERVMIGVKVGGDSGPAPSSVEQPPGPHWVLGAGRDDAPQVTLSVGFRGGRGLEPGKHAARSVLRHIVASRLTSLRENLAVTYGFSASYTPRIAGGSWILAGSADARRADEAATAVQRMLAELRGDRDSYRADFILARRKVLDSLLASASDSFSVAERLEYMARFDLPATFYADVARAVAGLTLDDIHAVVTEELTPRRQVFGVYGPKRAVRQALEAARSVRFEE